LAGPDKSQGFLSHAPDSKNCRLVFHVRAASLIATIFKNGANLPGKGSKLILAW
jgi:hypothetical protein